MYQQQQNNDQMRMKDSFNLFYVLVNGHALTCSVFLRTNFGKEAIGFSGIAAALMILLYGGLMQSYATWVFFCIWMLAVLCQRMKQFQNWRNGVIVHSRYNGFPWLAFKLFPRLKNEGNAKGTEAFMCLAVGWLLTYIDQPLGWLIMGGFLSIMFSEAIMVEFNRKRLQAMRDAEIEQQYLAEQYREGRF